VIPCCPLVSNIKLCLDRGASESLDSISTWIWGDQQVTDTTGKLLMSFFFPSGTSFSQGISIFPREISSFSLVKIGIPRKNGVPKLALTCYITSS
jgi:hypothetical protein